MIYLVAANFAVTSGVLIIGLVYNWGRFSRGTEDDGKSFDKRIAEIVEQQRTHNEKDEAAFTKIQSRLDDLAYKMQTLPATLRLLFLPSDVSEGLETATGLKIDALRKDIARMEQDIRRLWERRSGRERRVDGEPE